MGIDQEAFIDPTTTMAMAVITTLPDSIILHQNCLRIIEHMEKGKEASVEPTMAMPVAEITTLHFPLVSPSIRSPVSCA